ncbi:MAG: metal ABC transporter ATP-binding protein [Candidatus Thorarchaeota archaeon]|nr:metal ABC transporter ATP-binding protein [Candidatus Thorarchaeota archaeon]
MNEAILFEAEDLAVRYPGGDLALHNINFKVKAPTFLAIVGPNGSGKSTLLKTSLGMLRPQRGYMRVLGYDTVTESNKIRKMVRYVPQRDRIEMSIPIKVKDIALMGRLLKKAPPRFARTKDKEIARNALKRVNMDNYWNHSFNELSGGQRQRVLVARALASDGSLLMLDEPLAGTDAESQSLIADVLGEYHQEHNVSIVMVTHDLNPIHSFVKDVLMLKNTVIGIGTPCDMMDPDLLVKVYGPSAKVVEYGGHRYCVTHDSGIDRHD